MVTAVLVQIIACEYYIKVKVLCHHTHTIIFLISAHLNIYGLLHDFVTNTTILLTCLLPSLLAPDQPRTFANSFPGVVPTKVCDESRALLIVAMLTLQTNIKCIGIASSYQQYTQQSTYTAVVQCVYHPIKLMFKHKNAKLSRKLRFYDNT